jgi:hypothetical protein
MPAIAPADKGGCEDADTGGGEVFVAPKVLVGVLVGAPSTGNPSPGLSARVEFSAYNF